MIHYIPVISFMMNDQLRIPWGHDYGDIVNDLNLIVDRLMLTIMN